MNSFHFKFPSLHCTSWQSRFPSFVYLLIFVLLLVVPQGNTNIFVSGLEEVETEINEEEKEDFGPTKIVVSEEGDTLVTIEYMLLTTGSVAKANKEYLLPPIAAKAGGILVVKMTYEELGYLSFGMSPLGTMVGGEVVIGEPSSNSANVPYKYRMESLEKTGIIRLADEKQTLIDAKIFQDVENGITTMEYAKLLNEEEELAIVEGQEHTFIWAVGRSNRMGYHAQRNSFTIKELLPGNIEPAPIIFGDATVPNQTIWMLHGIFAFLAWGLCAPVAIAAAVLKSYLPKQIVGLWYKIHYYGNLSCIVSTVIAVALAVYATHDKNGKHFTGGHELFGLLVLLIAGVQVIYGILRPPAHNPTPQLQPDTCEDGKDVKNDNNGYANNLSATMDLEKSENSDNGTQSHLQSQKKPTKRILFEVGHRIIGVTLMALSLYNIHTGLDIYDSWYMSTTTNVDEETGGSSDIAWTITAFWGYMGSFLGIVVLLKIINRCRTK